MRAVLELTKRPYKPTDMKSARDDAYAELVRVDAMLATAQEMGVRYAAALEREKQYRAGVIRFAAESDYCIVCDEHPSHGHKESCLFHE